MVGLCHYCAYLIAPRSGKKEPCKSCLVGSDMVSDFTTSRKAFWRQDEDAEPTVADVQAWLKEAYTIAR
jgi:hypothetical protein